MNEDSEVNRNNEKEEMRKIKRKKRNHDFHHMTKDAGRGVNRSLKKLHEKDAEEKIMNTHTKRKTIEEEIINHNKKLDHSSANKNVQ